LTKYKKLKLKDGSTIDEHRYVMQQHLGRTLTSDEVVHHIDGNGRNNKLSNLELTTRSKHSKDHWIDGTYKPRKQTEESKAKLSLAIRGENAANVILTEQNVIEIKHLLQTKITHKKIAEQYNVKRQTITSINSGNTWKHIKI